jgi:hypothetical protein
VAPLQPIKKWLVTKTETVTVFAVDEKGALNVAQDAFAWGNPGQTEDIQAEELLDD